MFARKAGSARDPGRAGRRPPRWIAATAIAIGAVAALVLVLMEASERGPAAAAPAPGAIRAVYLSDCAVCHGPDARGGAGGPSLAGQSAGSVDYWVSTGRMPLSSADASPTRGPSRYRPAVERALVRYVVALTGGDPRLPAVHPARGDLAAGGETYRLNCAACHSWGGTGGALLHRAAPSLRPATATQIAEAVRIGPGNMPAFGRAAITDDQLSSLVRYVRSLPHSDNRGGNPLGDLGPFGEGAVAWVLGMGAVVLVVRKIGSRS